MEIAMQKSCFKCGEEKPLDDFYKHKEMADGHLNKCKECTKSDSNARRYDPKFRDYVLSYDRLRGRDPIRKEKNNQQARRAQPSVKLAKARAWRSRNKDKQYAHSKVNNAIRDGLLVKQPCVVCGNPKSEGHHEDYSKPLDVVWLCRQHHAEVHRTYK